MERTLRQWVMAALALAVPVSAARAAEPGLPSRLRVLVSSDEMPEMFSFEAKGKPGFERELIEGFCRIHGLSLDVVRVKDFDQIIPMLQDHFQPTTWRAFWGHVVEEKPAQQVAAALGLSVAAVYKAKVRVLTWLHQELADLVA